MAVVEIQNVSQTFGHGELAVQALGQLVGFVGRLLHGGGVGFPGGVPHGLGNRLA